eukprot:943796-Prorocentrum_minimum.AAC.1
MNALVYSLLRDVHIGEVELGVDVRALQGVDGEAPVDQVVQRGGLHGVDPDPHGDAHNVGHHGQEE